MTVAEKGAIARINQLLETHRRNPPNYLTKSKMVEMISEYRRMTDDEKMDLQRCRYNDLLEIWQTLRDVTPWQEERPQWNPTRWRGRYD